MEQEYKDSEQEFKRAIRLLKDEISKDLLFFSFGGFVVILLLPVENFLKQWFLDDNIESLAGELFSGLISINPYGLVFLGLAFIGLIANLLSSINIQYDWLDDTVKHI